MKIVSGAAIALFAAFAAQALTMSTAHADELEEAKAVNEAAKAELEHALPGSKPGQKPALVPDDDKPVALPADSEIDVVSGDKPVVKGTTPLPKTNQDDCATKHRFWYGGHCHPCPVGKVAKDKTCKCPEGFLDNGPRLSCRCPEGMTVVYGRAVAVCKEASTKASEAIEARKKKTDAPLPEDDDTPGGACTGTCGGTQKVTK